MDVMNFITAAPEMTLLGMICVVLIADLFVDDGRRIPGLRADTPCWPAVNR